MTGVLVDVEEAAAERAHETLKSMWNKYAKAGYEKAYWTHSTRDLRSKMRRLFLETGGGKVLDAGCGTGGMFESTLRRMRPAELWAVDWSKEMLGKARLHGERFGKRTDTRLEFLESDLSQPLSFPDESFHAVLSNLVICYLPNGWRAHLEELHRVMEPRGHLYLSTLLREWDFSNAVRKFAPREFLRSPIGTLYGIRFKRMASAISGEGKKKGAEFPSKDELIDFLGDLGFHKTDTVPVYWGFGVALRTQKL